MSRRGHAAIDVLYFDMIVMICLMHTSVPIGLSGFAKEVVVTF
jgi:hypothetical protein